MTVIAVVDLGTNSTNLLLSDGDTVHRRTTEVTRLGEGVHRTHHLSESAMERTLEALRRHRKKCDDAGATNRRIVATSACRDAQNRNEFFDRAEAVFGVRPELLTGETEGQFAFRGAMATLPTPAPVLVVDIGGGSTEFMLGDSAGDLVVSRSLDVGALRLTEMELHSDPPRPEELTNAIGLVADMVDDVLREFPAMANVASLVGIGGTVNTVGRLELGTYDAELHGLTMSRATVEEIFRMLATEKLADRLHNPGLAADRAGIVVGGMCALVAVMRRLNSPEIVISRSGLMDGVARSMLETA